MFSPGRIWMVGLIMIAPTRKYFGNKTSDDGWPTSSLQGTPFLPCCDVPYRRYRDCIVLTMLKLIWGGGGERYWVVSTEPTGVFLLKLIGRIFLTRTT